MSFVPIFVAIIGSIAAGLVYVWQKLEDRKERFRNEKQTAFTDYLRSLREVVTASMNAEIAESELKNLNNTMLQHYHFSDNFELYASNDIKIIAFSVEEALLSWRQTVRNDNFGGYGYSDYLKARNSLVNAMRHDLFSSVETPMAEIAKKSLAKPLSPLRSIWAMIKGEKP